MQRADEWGNDDRTWEHRLPALLLTAFAVAGSATLLGPARPVPPDPLVLAPEVIAATAPAATAPGLVLVRIADVILADGTSSGVVLLEDREAHSVLPVFLKAAESAAVREGMKSGDPHSSPELLSSAVAALGGVVLRVELIQGEEEAVSSRVVLQKNNEEVFLPARAADALALAAVTHTPVFTSLKMLDSQGIRRETVEHLPGGLPSRLRNPETF